MKLVKTGERIEDGKTWCVYVLCHDESLETRKTMNTENVEGWVKNASGYYAREKADPAPKIRAVPTGKLSSFFLELLFETESANSCPSSIDAKFYYA